MLPTTTLLPLVILILSTTIDAVWIVAQVKEINWQQNCIQDRNCETVELSMILDSNTAEGAVQSSWKLENVLQNPQASKLLVHWTASAEFTNITLKSLLTANDILFNVPRPCDHSSALNVFSPMIKASAYNAPAATETHEAEVDKLQTIGLVGKCFHVIIEVRLYVHHCPWCVAPTSTKQANLNNTIPINRLLESPAFIGFVLFVLFSILIGIVICTLTLHKTRKLHVYQQQYTSSSFSDLPFNRPQMVSNIPLPPLLKPPLAPNESARAHQQHISKIHDGLVCPYYETLDTRALQKSHARPSQKDSSENYDSAFDQSLGASSNNSFSGPNSDSGRGSPHLMARSRAEYV